MRARGVLSILLVVPLLLAHAFLPALAWASLPDQSWISGIYDGADGDDVVALALAASASGLDGPDATRDHRPNPPLIGTVAPLSERLALGASRSALRSRAPPSA